MNVKVGKQAIAEASKKLSNWGRWGEDDEAKRRHAARWRDFEAAAKVLAEL